MDRISASAAIDDQLDGLEVVNFATLGLKSNCGFPIGTQRNLQVAFDSGLELSGLDPTELEPNSQIKLHLNLVNPSTGLLLILRLQIGTNKKLLSGKQGVQDVGGFVSLVKRGESDRAEPLALIVGSGFDAIVVDAELLVRVSDGEVEGKVVVEVAVGGEVELSECGVCDVKLDTVRFNYEPEDEEGEAHEDDGGEDELEDEAEDATAATAEGASAAADAFVGALLRRDGWAVIGAIQACLFLRHGS